MKARARASFKMAQVFSRLVDDLRPEAILKMRSVSGIPVRKEVPAFPV